MLFRHTGDRYTMAATLDLALPEITVEDFGRAWTRFELVAKAKEWDAAGASDFVAR